VLLPGSTMLVALGVWSAASQTPAVLPIAVAASASVLGAWAGWRRGHGRRGLNPSQGRLRARVDPAVRRARSWFATQGTAGTVLLLAVAHWAAVTRTLVPRVAGGAGVPFRLAAPVIAASGTAWVTTVVLLARAIGRRVADDASWAPAVVLGALGVALLVRHWRHAHEHAG
jgi:membrane-associated protein